MDKYAEINSELSGYLRRSSQGDKIAFEKIYALTAPKLNAIILGMVKDQSLTEDILQRAYVSIWKNAGSYDPAKGKAFTWMLVITRNRAIDVLRQQKRRTVTEQVPETIEDETAIADDGARSFLLRRLMAPHLDSLSPYVRQSIMLFTVQGMNSREIGEKLGVSPNTVKSWIRRGLAKLKTDLDVEDLDSLI